MWSSPESPNTRSSPPLPASESLVGNPLIVSSPAPPIEVKKKAIFDPFLFTDAPEGHSADGNTDCRWCASYPSPAEPMITYRAVYGNRKMREPAAAPHCAKKLR